MEWFSIVWNIINVLFWLIILWGLVDLFKNQKIRRENQAYVDKWVPLLNMQIQIGNFSVKGYQAYILIWQHQQGAHQENPYQLWCLLCRVNHMEDTNVMEEMNRIGHTITSDSKN